MSPAVIQALELLAIGSVAGVLGGLLGIGGGLVMIPALLLFLGERFGPDSFHLYKLAAIATSVVLSVPAVIRHNRAQAVNWNVVKGIVPLAVLGVVAGVIVSGQFTGEATSLLRRTFGVFMELVVAFQLFQTWRLRQGERWLRDRCPTPSRRWLYGSVVGLPAGVLGGLLGIGGGAWAVPAQRLILSVQLRYAIANSSCMVAAVAITTSVGQSVAVMAIDGLSVWNGWWLALWLAPGAIAGGWIGAGLTHRLPTKWLRYAFYGLLAVTGAKLIVS